MRSEGLKTHKDLDVWKRAMDLAVEIYSVTARFPSVEVHGLAQQMRKSAVSVVSNIAEGSARSSKKERAQLLHVSLGSLAELETQLILAIRVAFLTDNTVLNRVEQLRKMLLGLIRFVKKRL